jgi:hypothetical protein
MPCLAYWSSTEQNGCSLLAAPPTFRLFLFICLVKVGIFLLETISADADFDDTTTRFMTKTKTETGYMIGLLDKE